MWLLRHFKDTYYKTMCCVNNCRYFLRSSETFQQKHVQTALQHIKMSPEVKLSVHLEPCLIFFLSLQLDEVSQLLLGQRTGNTTQLGAGSEDCGTQFTAEHIKTEDRLPPWLLENSSVETPRAAVTLCQTEEENESG